MTGSLLPSSLALLLFGCARLLLVLPPTRAQVTQGNGDLSFGLINGGSPFFGPIYDGWKKQCQDLDVTCYYRVANSTEDSCAQRIDLVHEFLALGVHGISLKPCSAEVMRPLFEEATAAGISIVTFDSDVENSTRAAYIGTDQVFLGRTMARLLRQLRPEGGSYAIVGPKEGRLEGFVQEIERDNHRDDRAHWYEAERNFSLDGIEFADGIDKYLAEMEALALLNPTAMITMKQTPMRHPNWTSFVDANRHREITYVGVDGADFQLAYLNQRYVDGLVGQLPYEMGSVSLQVLYDMATKGPMEETVIPTNIVSYNLIPIELPPLELNQNLLGGLKYIGLVCFAVVGFLAVACMAWTLYHRTCHVVRVAQPFFLIMVAAGVLIMSSALVPLSYDDNGEQPMSTKRSQGICMSVPWLAFTGFTVTFSALFSKTWRVNRIFRAQASFSRVHVSVKDVVAPFACLLTCNFVVLICWTVLDPLHYVRQFDDGTDFWNREFESYGACRSDHAVAFLVPLVVLNAMALAIACWQAVEAKDITCEFSEAKYIGLTLASILQTFLTGIPIVAVVRDMPQAFYLVLTFMIFVLSVVILVFIFLPKIANQRKYAGMSESQQKSAIKSSIHRSSNVASLVGSKEFTDSCRYGDNSARFGDSSAPFKKDDIISEEQAVFSTSAPSREETNSVTPTGESKESQSGEDGLLPQSSEG